MKFELDQLLLDLKKHRPPGRAIAAFDADGTLWNTDLGDSLFDYQVKNKLVPLPIDPWAHYHDLKNVSRRTAYLWLAQINKGLPIATVRQWAQKAVESMKPIPIFPDQARIMGTLQELEVEIFIVTASIQWAVAPAAHLFNLPEDHVLGIETEVVDGIVSDRQKGILTFREGKIQALLAATDGIVPYFCAGNTEGDQFLLEGASHLRMVVAAAPPTSENYESERSMVTLAEARGWYVQDHLAAPDNRF